MSAYSIQAQLHPHVEKAVREIRASIPSMDGVRVISDEPHMTLVYGPELRQGETEALTKEEMCKVYPGLEGDATDAASAAAVATTTAAAITTIATTAAIGKATLVAGYQVVIPLPPGVTYERYLGARYTVATGPLTAGAFSFFITDAPQNWNAVPAGA